MASSGNAPHESPAFTVIPAQKDTMISLALDGKMVLDRRIGGSRWVQRQLLENALHLIPRDTQVEARLHGAGNSIQIYIKDEFVRAVVGDMVKGDPSHLELRPLFGVADAALAHLLRVAKSALDLPAIVSIPHADTVAAALVSHLVQYHSNKTIRLPLAEALARPQMERVICYIHSELHNAISLAELAAVAGLSVSQLIRHFKEVEGLPPHAYIMKARIDKARQLLERNRESIAGIAIDCGFDSQSSLTRAFQRLVGTTPAVYRRVMGKGGVKHDDAMDQET
jgi:AraC family transcriptional regulator